MASASFTLKAVDQTQAAFASAQNNLDKTSNKIKELNASFAGRGLLSGLGIGSGFQAAQTLVDKITEGFREAAEFAEKIEGFTKRSLEFTLRSIKASQSPEQQMAQLIKDQNKIIQQRKELEKPRFFFAQAQPGFAFDKSKRAGMREAGKTPEQLLQIAEFIEQENKLADEIAKIQEKITENQIKGFKEIEIQRQRDQDLRIESLRAGLDISEQDFNKFIKDQSDKTDAFKKERESLEQLAEKYKDIADPSRVFIRQIQEINRLAADGKINFEQAAKAVESMTSAMNENEETRVDAELKNFFTDIDERANRIHESLKQQNQIFKDSGAIISQGFEDAIISGEKLGEVVRSLGRDLLRLVFNQMVTQPLASGISGFIQAAFTPRAMGGPVSSGSPYVVGEKGPELFVPHASGTIVPNNKMGSGGGSGGAGGVTINYNIASGVSRAELVPILDQERRRLKAEIPDMVRRGGAYRAAFA